jgi:NAD(P)-dependent dehydrogenase (short-subunit alcohol dehydrogenase family)
MNDILDMTGHTALVTGAGQGVGRQVALHIAGHGGAVIVNDYHAERAESVAAEIAEAGGRAVGLRCDVTDLHEVTAMVEHCSTKLGPVDVLVNNAGNAGPADDPLARTPPFWETGPKDWEPWIATNFYGVLTPAGRCYREWSTAATAASSRSSPTPAAPVNRTSRSMAGPRPARPASPAGWPSPSDVTGSP